MKYKCPQGYIVYSEWLYTKRKWFCLNCKECSFTKFQIIKEK